VRDRLWVSHEQGAEEELQVGVVADDEEVFVIAAGLQKAVEVGDGGFRGEGGGLQDLGLVAGFGGDELGGLERSLERAGDDEVEVDLEGVEQMGEVQAVLLSLSIERTLEIEEWIGAAGSGAGVTENEQIHRTVTIIRALDTRLSPESTRYRFPARSTADPLGIPPVPQHTLQKES
jgi:hypothetical protein